MEYQHGYQNEQSLYWNSKTRKFVIRLRQTAKGKAIGQTKGKSIGKAIGKAVGASKGSTYSKELESIKRSDKSYKSPIAWLPINLTLEIIEARVKEHWSYKSCKFEMDRLLALFTLLVVKRHRFNTDSEDYNRNYYYKEGYVHIGRKELREWVHTEHYHKYVEFAINAQIIGCLDYYIAGRYSKKFRFHPFLLAKPGDYRKYYKVDYVTDRMKVKLYRIAQEKKKEFLTIEARRQLTANLYTILSNYDIDGFTAWAKQNPGEFSTKKDKEGIDTLNNNITHLARLQTLEGVYLNPKDKYGFRYHHPFSNIKKEARGFIRIAGEYAVEVDVKNSQFFLLAILTRFGRKACFKQIFKNLDDPLQKSAMLNNIELMEYYYSSYSDFREFINYSLDGNIYEHTLAKMKSKKSKGYIKGVFFKAFFSKREQCEKSKTMLRKLYPNLVKICEKMNATAAPLPFILQRAESFFMLDLISTKANHNLNYEYLTVHDSFICHRSDALNIKRLMKETFQELGLPAPKIKMPEIFESLSLF